MSLVNNLFTKGGESWVCLSAEKNITNHTEYKDVNIKLVYGCGHRRTTIGSVYSVNLGEKISLQRPLKMYVKEGTESQVTSNKRVSAFAEHEFTESMIEDIIFINLMFDKAHCETKRVYL